MSKSPNNVFSGADISSALMAAFSQIDKNVCPAVMRDLEAFARPVGVAVARPPRAGNKRWQCNCHPNLSHFETTS